MRHSGANDLGGFLSCHSLLLVEELLDQHVGFEFLSRYLAQIILVNGSVSSYANPWKDRETAIKKRYGGRSIGKITTGSFLKNQLNSVRSRFGTCLWTAAPVV